MKWLGQYLQNFKATFRQDVTLDSTLTFDSVSLSAVQTSSESFVDNDTSLMTSAAIDDRINTAVTAEDLDLTSDSGTIDVDLNSETLTISGGSGIDTSATGTTVTIAGEDASTSNKGVASFDSNHFSTSSGAVSLGSTITTDGIVFTSANVDDPNIEIRNTNTNAQAARLTMRKDPGEAGADNDVISELEFFSVNDAGTPEAQMYGKIITKIHDATDGQESGDMEIRVATHDGELQEGLKMTGGAVEDEINVTIGGPATSSTTTVSGDLTISGDTLTFNSQIGRRTCFEFKGYGTSSVDGEGSAVYEMPELMTDNKAPFEHDTTTGTDGLTAQTTSTVIRSGGIVMPHAGSCKTWKGWVTSQGTGAVDIGLFKFTPIDNSASNVEPVLVDNTQITAAGNTKMRLFTETSFTATFAAGDVLYSAVKGAVDAKAWYLLSTLEVEWS